MRFKAVIEAEAELEFAEAVAFYDDCDPGLGQKFAHNVQEVFKTVCENPERFPLYGRLTRKTKVLDWPYSVFFAVKTETSELVIISVWHGSRDPAELRRRLK